MPTNGASVFVGTKGGAMSSSQNKTKKQQHITICIPFRETVILFGWLYASGLLLDMLFAVFVALSTVCLP